MSCGAGGRGQRAVAGPEVLLGHDAGEELLDLGQDGGAFRRPVCDELVGRRVVGAHVTVWSGADESPQDLGQAEAEGVALPFADEVQQVGGNALPVADRRPVGSATQFVSEGGQRDDLSRMSSLGEAVVDLGPVGLPYPGWSREAAATRVVLISWAPGPG